MKMAILLFTLIDSLGRVWPIKSTFNLYGCLHFYEQKLRITSTPTWYKLFSNSLCSIIIE